MDRNLLKKRRIQLGMTQQQVADLIEVQKPTYQRYESGVIKKIDTVTVEKLAKALNTTPEFLSGWNKPYDSNEKIINFGGIPVNTSEMVLVPVLGRVAAGQNILADNNISGIEMVSKNELTDDFEYFYLRVKGDSMYPTILENDLVLVRRQTSVDSGTLAVVTVEGEEGLVKNVVYGKDFIELHSINPFYPVRRFEGKDVLAVYVIGKVIEIKRKLI